jgi:hypothetical protein
MGHRASRQRFIASLEDDPVCARRVEGLYESPPDFELVLGTCEADPRRIEVKARAGDPLPTDGRAFRAMPFARAFDLRGAIRCAEKRRAHVRVRSTIGSIFEVTLLKARVFTAELSHGERVDDACAPTRKDIRGVRSAKTGGVSFRSCDIGDWAGHQCFSFGGAANLCTAGPPLDDFSAIDLVRTLRSRPPGS